jgi:dihydrodipicolinate synthase/N-acetylneuraminate lyase
MYENKLDLQGVFAVAPLARKADAQQTIDFEQNNLIVNHIRGGGISRLLYGGNAFLYHLTLKEYEQLIEWLSDYARDMTVIPSAGPTYGRAMDQAELLRPYQFDGVMMLPCGDPRDATGLERGYRQFADAAQTPLFLYLKDEMNLGADRDAGLGLIERLVNDGVCIGIKYAVVREDPEHDLYLDSLLARVDSRLVVSGIGERPAIAHLRKWNIPGFTTGSGCIAPDLSQRLFEACGRDDFDAAHELRAKFIPLEDLRDAWGPARVLHAATDLAGIASLGEVPPYLSDLNESQKQELSAVVHELVKANLMLTSQSVASQSLSQLPT